MNYTMLCAAAKSYVNSRGYILLGAPIPMGLGQWRIWVSDCSGAVKWQESVPHFVLKSHTPHS